MLLALMSAVASADGATSAFDTIAEDKGAYSLLGIRIGEKISDITKRMPGVLSKVMDDKPGVDIYNIKGEDDSAVYADGDDVIMVLHSLGRITPQAFKHLVAGMTTVGGAAVRYKDDPSHLTWMDFQRRHKVDIKHTLSGECVFVLYRENN